MDIPQPKALARRLYTAAQVRELDRAAIEDHDVPGIELMERAGRAAFNAIRERFADRARWLVVCGGGNNGGDGYVIARLAREADIACRLSALKAPEDLAGDAGIAARRWLDAGGTVEMGPPRDLADFNLIVDAMLGTGLDRAPRGEYADAIGSINASDAHVVAVDVPSGVNADSGCAMGGIAVRAHLTVSFVGQKRGLYTADGPDYAGRVMFSTLDIPEAIFNSILDSGILIHEKIIDEWLGKRRRNSHKGDYGWLVGVGGERGMSGAIRMCGDAALRSGVGKVTLATHPVHASMLNIARPELMVRAVESADDLGGLLESADVVVLGTGLGRSEWSRSLLDIGLRCGKPMVLDADALNLLAADRALDSLSSIGNQIVVTPHPAEAGRLLDRSARSVQGDRVGAAQELARVSGAVVVLKGCGTVISEPEGHYAICPLGNPGMASAGAGDVLSGAIGGLMGQGLGAWKAAVTGVVAHAAAGDRAAAVIGERGLIASDIIERLPAVLNPS